MDLAGSIASYIREDRSRLRGALDFYQGQTTLREAVRKAALSKRPRDWGREKREDHQRRLKRAVLEQAADRLGLESALKKLRGCKDFDALMKVVKDQLDGIKGVGELTRYDITLRNRSEAGPGAQEGLPACRNASRR